MLSSSKWIIKIKIQLLKSNLTIIPFFTSNIQHYGFNYNLDRWSWSYNAESIDSILTLNGNQYFKNFMISIESQVEIKNREKTMK